MSEIIDFKEVLIDDWLLLGIEHIYPSEKGIKRIGENNRRRFIRRVKSLEHLIIEGKAKTEQRIREGEEIRRAYSYEQLAAKYSRAKIYFPENKRTDYELKRASGLPDNLVCLYLDRRFLFALRPLCHLIIATSSDEVVQKKEIERKLRTAAAGVKERYKFSSLEFVSLVLNTFLSDPSMEETNKYIAVGQIFEFEYIAKIREELYFYPLVDKLRNKEGRKGIVTGRDHLKTIGDFVKDYQRMGLISWQEFAQKHERYDLIKDFEENSPLIYRG